MNATPDEVAYEMQGPQPNSEGSDPITEQTFPTLHGVLQSYRLLEREMFAHPEDAERYAEMLSLTRQQMRDHRMGDSVDSQKFGARDMRVTPADPDEVQRLMLLGVATKVPREKNARQVAEDDLLRAGLAPILASLPIPQLDAVRHVHWFQSSIRETAASLGVHRSSVVDRLNRAYASIAAAIPVTGYRAVRTWLVGRGQQDRATREVMR